MYLEYKATATIGQSRYISNHGGDIKIDAIAEQRAKLYNNKLPFFTYTL